MDIFMYGHVYVQKKGHFVLFLIKLISDRSNEILPPRTV